jgi:hypothetical protein
MALGEVHFIRPGILGVQLEMMRMGTSDNFPDKPLRTISLGDGNEITFLAEPVRYHEGKKYKTAAALINEIDFASASWRRAIYQLPEDELAWLLYCYGNKILNYDLQVEICVRVWIGFLHLHRASGFKKMKAKTTEIMRRLVYLTVQETRKGILTGREDVGSDFLMSELMGITERTWREHYKKRWRLMQNVCANLDASALIRTQEKRNENLQRHRAGNAAMPVQTGL